MTDTDSLHYIFNFILEGHSPQEKNARFLAIAENLVSRAKNSAKASPKGRLTIPTHSEEESAKISSAVNSIASQIPHVHHDPYDLPTEDIKLMLENAGNAASSIALRFAGHLAENEDGRKRLMENDGELARILMDTKPPSAAEIIAKVMVETENGKKLLGSEEFFSAFNHATVTYFTHGLKENPEAAATLLAANGGALGKTLTKHLNSAIGSSTGKWLQTTMQNRPASTIQDLLNDAGVGTTPPTRSL
jgi:hypothetical protein